MGDSAAGMKDIYWGEFPEAEMDTLLSLLQEEGYEAARKYIDKTLDRTDFIFGKGRSDFMYYLPLHKRARVLDCGCGLGTHSFNIAPYVKEVHGFDQSKKRIEFCNYRKKFERVRNVDFAHADFERLPYKDDYFDTILLNGVVEWLGERNRNEDPRKDQLEVLRLLHKKLRPGGVLYIGIENRYALAYLAGRDHNGLRWTSYMPRPLADAVTKLFAGRPYRTYTYSLEGYRSLMKDAGFGSAEFFVAHPGYNYPQFIVPAHDIGSLRYFFSNMTRHKGPKGATARLLSRFEFGLRCM